MVYFIISIIDSNHVKHYQKVKENSKRVDFWILISSCKTSGVDYITWNYYFFEKLSC